jgi:hypothetical protein
MLDVNCPQCGSKQTKSYPMIHQAGTTTTSRNSNTITSRGRARATSSNSVRQTKLAASTAPPAAPSNLLGCFSAFVTCVIVWIVAANLLPAIAHMIPPAVARTFQPFAGIASFIVALLAALLIYKITKGPYRRRRAQFEAEMDEWQRSWLCLRCGASWSYR